MWHIQLLLSCAGEREREQMHFLALHRVGVIGFLLFSVGRLVILAGVTYPERERENSLMPACLLAWKNSCIYICVVFYYYLGLGSQARCVRR